MSRGSKRIFLIGLIFLACMFVLIGCGLLQKKGLTKEQEAEIDARVEEYKERIIGPTWHSDADNWSLKFYEDGRIEEEGHISEPGNWYISYGEQYNRNADISKMSRKYLEEYCDIYVRWNSPAYIDNKAFDCKIRFDEDGNMYLFDSLYVPSVDYLHEIPEDATLDSYFYGNFGSNNWGVWAFVNDDNEEGSLWVFQDDGIGAESIGSMNGELIYPDMFHWAVKDDMLYIEWARDDEYVEEYGKDIDAYHVRRGDGEFWIQDYLDENAKEQHLKQTDKLDIYTWD